MFKTLISTEALAEHLDGPAVVVVDCRFKLDDLTWGERAYAAGHIPGAVYASLARDLSGPTTGANGRHPLPSPDALVRTFGRYGIASDEQVVAYDQDSGMFASRLWWLLRWMGHDLAAVLDGGLAKWNAEGRAVSTAVGRPAERQFAGAPRADMVVGADEVAAHIGSHDWHLLDARAPERFRGDVEPLDKVAGHIPSATDHFFQRNLNERGTFRAPEELGAAFGGLIGGIQPDHLVCYCGSGVTACHNLLALEHAGLRGAKLYPGSWSEWSSDPSRPIATEK